MSVLYAIVLSIIFLDQATKLLIRNTLRLGQSIPIIPHVFDITYVLNPGAAFGLLAGRDPSFRNPFFIAISILAILLILYYYYHHRERRTLQVLGLSFILGGAVGNLIDRLSIGMVVDFLDFHYGRYHWPAFNVADSAITIGVLLMMVDIVRGERRGDG